MSESGTEKEESKSGGAQEGSRRKRSRRAKEGCREDEGDRGGEQRPKRRHV